MPSATDALRRARAHRAANELARSDAAYREALRADPERLEAWAGLAHIYAGHGHAQEARAVVQACLARMPLDSGAWALGGTIHLELGELETAVSLFDKALELDANEITALFGKGMAEADLGHLEAAVQTLEHFLDLDDERVPVHIVLTAAETLRRIRDSSLPG